MSAKGSSGAMTHEDMRAVREAEGELARLLAIDPSPDFAAHVHARILQQGNSRRWHFRWDLVSRLAAAAVLVTAAAFMAAHILRAPAGTQPPVAAPAISAPAQPGNPLDARLPLPAVPLREPVRPTVPLRSRTMVLVPPDAQRALQRVVELAAIGALSAGAAELPAPLTETPSQPVAPIVVEEIDVIDIAVSGDAMEDEVD
jgi:hypothetical protein